MQLELGSWGRQVAQPLWLSGSATVGVGATGRNWAPPEAAYVLRLA